MEAMARVLKIAGGPSKVAAALGVSPQAVVFWRAGKRRLPHEHGAAIERLTGGAVTRRELWAEDWHRVWPELIDADHPAPSPEAKAA